jgi:hypothetical protein
VLDELKGILLFLNNEEFLVKDLLNGVEMWKSNEIDCVAWIDVGMEILTWS